MNEARRKKGEYNAQNDEKRKREKNRIIRRENERVIFTYWVAISFKIKRNERIGRVTPSCRARCMPPRTVSLAVQGQRRPKSELRKPCSPSSGVRAASCFNNRHSATHTQHTHNTHAHTFSHTRTAVTTHSSDTEPVFFFFFRLLTPLQCEIHIIITTATPAPAPATTTTRTTELCSNAAQGQTVIVDNENYFPPTPTERFFTRFGFVRILMASFLIFIFVTCFL